jgi:hypothetical protein
MDNIGGIGGQSAALRQTVQQRAGDMVAQHAQKGDAQDTAGARTIDAEELSDEALEQAGGVDGEQDDSKIDALLKNILDMKDQENAGEEGAGVAEEQGAPEAQKAGAAEAAGDKKTIEEVKVSWQPLMQPGQLVNEGEPFGHFQISREKKEVDDKKGPGEGGAPAQGAAPQGGMKGKKAGGAAALTLTRDIPKGSDGKTPMVQQGMNPGEQKKQEKGVEAGEGGKLYITDQGTGERMEIPENGELKATHPMKIKSIGTVGELKPGDELFSYENPAPDELEKAKKSKEMGQGPQEMEETKKQDQK